MRLQPEQRRSVIMTAALRIARQNKKLTDVNHGAVAKRCSVATSVSLVRHYYPTQRDLWMGVIKKDRAFLGQANELGIKV